MIVVYESSSDLGTITDTNPCTDSCESHDFSTVVSLLSSKHSSLESLGDTSVRE